MRTESGAAPVESVVAIVLLLVLALGVVQVALLLYGRNSVLSAAHEGARAGIELGRSPAEAEAIARRATASAAGGLVQGLKVDASATTSDDLLVLTVTLSGRLVALGPVPWSPGVSVRATTARDVVDER
jgi:Flp pilus assembly protein TadG